MKLERSRAMRQKNQKAGHKANNKIKSKLSHCINGFFRELVKEHRLPIKKILESMCQIPNWLPHLDVTQRKPCGRN